MIEDVLSSQLAIEFNEHNHRLSISPINSTRKNPWPMIEISQETLAEMSFSEASQFIGEKILLLIPAMRDQFKDYLWTDDGQTPPKKS
jgi:hypothetical protein